MTWQLKYNESSQLDSNADPIVQFKDSTTNRVTITQAGRVGVGTTSPGDLLELVGGAGSNAGLIIQAQNAHLKLYTTQGAKSWNLWSSFSATTDFAITEAGNTTDDGTARLTIAAGGYVGIGTTSPSTLLDVRGQISANAGSTSNPAYGFVSDLDTGMYSPSANTIGLVTGGTERLTIDSSGRVGIGTTSPSSDLSFGGESARTIKLEARTSNAAGSALSIAAGAAGGGASAYAGGQLNLTAGVAAGTGNASGGSVVINGGAKVGSGSNGNVVLCNSVGKVGIGTATPGTMLEVTGGQITVDPGAVETPGYGFVGETNTGMYRPSAGQLAFTTLSQEVMRIDDGLQVGIGITTPDSRLTVKGTGNSSATSSLNITDSGNNSLFYVRDDGKIGIGTTSPQGDLSFGGETSRTIKVEAKGSNAAGNSLSIVAGAAGSGATAYAGGQFNLTGGAAAGTSGNGNGGSVVINGGQKVNSGSRGNVILGDLGGQIGMGTASPSTNYLVEINGALKMGGALKLLSATSAPSNPEAGMMYFDNNGSTKQVFVYDGTTWQKLMYV